MKVFVVGVVPSLPNDLEVVGQRLTFQPGRTWFEASLEINNVASSAIRAGADAVLFQKVPGQLVSALVRFARYAGRGAALIPEAPLRWGIICEDRSAPVKRVEEVVSFSSRQDADNAVRLAKTVMGGSFNYYHEGCNVRVVTSLPAQAISYVEWL